jgi:hypothetical protein
VYLDLWDCAIDDLLFSSKYGVLCRMRLNIDDIEKSFTADPYWPELARFFSRRRDCVSYVLNTLKRIVSNQELKSNREIFDYLFAQNDNGVSSSSTMTATKTTASAIKKSFSFSSVLSALTSASSVASFHVDNQVWHYSIPTQSEIYSFVLHPLITRFTDSGKDGPSEPATPMDNLPTSSPKFNDPSQRKYITCFVLELITSLKRNGVTVDGYMYEFLYHLLRNDKALINYMIQADILQDTPRIAQNLEFHPALDMFKRLRKHHDVIRLLLKENHVSYS